VRPEIFVFFQGIPLLVFKLGNAKPSVKDQIALEKKWKSVANDQEAHVAINRKETEGGTKETK
jgi:hypothetical protein